MKSRSGKIVQKKYWLGGLLIVASVLVPVAVSQAVNLPSQLIFSPNILNGANLNNVVNVKVAQPSPLSEITAVPTPGTDTTPSYSYMSSKRSGSVAYGGDCTSSQTNVSYGRNTITFNKLAIGTHANCTLTYYYAAGDLYQPLKVSPFTIITMVVPPITGGGTGTNGGGGVINPIIPPTGNIIIPTGGGSSGGTGTDTGTTGGTVLVTPTVVNPCDGPLSTSPDILSCKATAKFLYFEGDQPAYDVMGMNCSLKQGSIVSASIFDKSFDPRSADNSASLIKKIKVAENLRKGELSITWNGFDDFDQVAPLGDYVFEVEAKMNCTYSPDISVQKFTIENAPNPVPADTSTICPALPTSPLTAKVPTAAPTHISCPGVNYPSDIGNSPAKDLIWKAYCLYFVEGYPVAGSPSREFKGGQNITRAEATKIAVLAAGHAANTGCKGNLTCGTPFVDLDLWQGGWLSDAVNSHMVVGVSPFRFEPNRSITKAEAASLISRALKIAPFAKVCTDPSCGAGMPDDKFLDVINEWEGPWLRSLWDIRAVHTEVPNKYFPDKAITREEFVETLMKAWASVGPDSVAGSGV